MRSWRKEVMVLLIAILLAVLVFLFGMISYFNSELTWQLLQRSESDLSYWMNVTEHRLNSVRNNVYEILLTIYNNATVAQGSGSLSFPVTKRCQDLMEDQLTINPDADCYFVVDSDTGWLLLSAASRLSHNRILSLKEYARSLDFACAGGISDRSWSLCTVGGATYFLKLTRMGKYMAGALCCSKTFSSIGNINAFEADSSIILLQDGRQFYGGGASDWVDELLFDADGRPYFESDRLTVTAYFPLLGCDALFTTPNISHLEAPDLGTAALFMTVIVTVLSLLALVTLIIFRRVVAPTRELLKAQEQLGAGNMDYRITRPAGSSEFNILFRSFNSMAAQIKKLRIETYDRLLQEQESKFQMVRAQIKPHFYLNAITVISNMTYQNRLEDIRTYIQALAKHIRYMLNIQSTFISVAEELTHIDNYLKMQELRFPGSVCACITCAEEAKGARIPFLVLFTAVENSFKHALNLYKPMELAITCEAYCEEGFSGWRLSVEDNGDGFPPEVLETFMAPVSDEPLPAKDHLGLSNIKYTLHYIYKRGGLLRLSNTGHGARTEILIPTEATQHEASHL